MASQDDMAMMVKILREKPEAAAAYRKINEQMGDIEFQADVNPLMGPGMSADPSKANMIQSNRMLNLQGYYVPEKSSEKLKKMRRERYQFRGEKFPMEPDSVNVFPHAARPQTWAHEFNHRERPLNSEKDTRILDAMFAVTKDQYAEALDMYQQYIREPDINVAQKELINTLRRWDRVGQSHEGKHTEGEPRFWKRLD